MFSKLIYTAVALSMMASAAPALAQSDDVPSVKVSISGLNLNSTASAREVLARIRTAADAVCGSAPPSLPWGRRSAYEACFSQAVGGAVAATGSPMVTAMADHAQPIIVAAR